MRGCGQRVGGLHPVLGVADSRQRYPGRQQRFVDVGILQGLLDRRQLVGRVVDDEVAGQADRRRFAAEQPRAQRMKRRDPHLAAIGADEQLDPRPHFLRRLIGEGDGEYFLRLGVAVADQIRGAAGDDARLARSGAGEDEQRAVDVKDGFTPFGIERR